MNNVNRKTLLHALMLCEQIKKYDKENEPHAATLSHSLLDIEESFNKIYQKIIPEIICSSNSDEIYNALLDVGEEIRHIIYHIKDSDFFNYLSEENDIFNNSDSK